MSNPAGTRRRKVIGTLAASAVALVVAGVYFSDISALSGRQNMPYLTGVNLAGAEFGPNEPPDGPRGEFGTQYTYPISELTPGYQSPRYFLSKGMNTFRLPFKWERIQHELKKPLDRQELARLELTVDRLTKLGAWVILDLHNYARYEDELIGSETVSADAFADVWRRLAKKFGKKPRVILGLMNEPYDINSEVWVDAANKAIRAIRETGAQNIIFVGGNSYSSTMHWYEDFNAEALLHVSDPLERVVFEGHLYLDMRSTGLKETCVNEMIGVERVQPFLRWLRENNKVGFIGEFGGGKNARCAGAIANLVEEIGENKDVVLGWTYWAAGPWWPTDYFTSIEPEENEDAPQLVALLPHIVSASGPTIPPHPRKLPPPLPEQKDE